MSETVETTEVSREALIKAQKRRNVWLAWALVAFVVVVGLTTALRIQETDFSGGDRLYFTGYMDEAASEKADREAQARIQARQEAERAAAANEAQSEEPGDE